MAQEDENQTQRCCNSTNTSSGVSGAGKSSNNGRSFKKQRPKKVPQRGLGVAQLEKIRIEEQRKKDGVVSSSPTVCYNSPHLSLPIPSFHLSNQSSTYASSTPLCVQNIGTVSTGNIGSGNHGYNLWSSYGYNIEKECSSGLDPGLVFKTNLSSFPYESEPIWPLPSLMQRTQAASSMVNNLTSRTSSTSILNFQMEPPSNQSSYGNCTYCLKNTRKGHYYSTSKGVFDGDFLTLAPPTTTSMSSSSKSKHPQSGLINGELAYQASFDDSILRQDTTGTGYRSNEHRPYYSFFPPAMVEIDQVATISMANYNGEVGHVDLNLKL